MTVLTLNAQIYRMWILINTDLSPYNINSLFVSRPECLKKVRIWRSIFYGLMTGWLYDRKVIGSNPAWANPTLHPCKRGGFMGTTYVGRRGGTKSLLTPKQ